MLNEKLLEQADISRNNALAALANGNLPNALHLFHNALDLNRKDEVSAREIANLYFQNGDFLEAEKYACKGILTPEKSTAHIWEILYYSRLRLDKTEDREEDLLNGLWYFPQSPTLWMALGQVHQSNQQFAAAGIHYLSAIKAQLSLQNSPPDPEKQITPLTQAVTQNLQVFCQNLRQQLQSFASQEIFGNTMKMMQEGKYEEAQLPFERLTFMSGNAMEVIQKLGICSYKNEDFARGALYIRQASEQKPEGREILISLAHCLRNWEKDSEALDLLESILDFQSQFPAIEFARADLMVRLEKTEDAREIINRKLEETPEDLRYIKRLVRLLATNKEFEDAIPHLKKILNGDPERESTHTLCAIVYEGVDDFDKAAMHYEKAIDLKPENKQNWVGYASLLAENLKMEKARELFEKAKELEVDSDGVAYAIGTINLFMGNWVEGWKGYEKRDAINKEIIRTNQPLWTGEQDVSGKRVLVIFEQGIGDLVQFIRTLHLLKSRGAWIILVVPNQSCALLESFGVFDEMVAFSTWSLNQIVHDYYIPLMSLPAALDYVPGTDNLEVPYLKADPEKIAHWKKRIDEIYSENLGGKSENPLRIGMFWQGNPNYKLDHKRSVHLKNWKPVLERNDAVFFSMQKFEGREQFSEVDFADRLIDMDDELDTDVSIFTDTAAALLQLDLLITSDSAIAHLAGALGVKTWLMLGMVPDWRWGTEGTETIWYPNTRLFRQTVRKSWSEVMEEICRELDLLSVSPVARRGIII